MVLPLLDADLLTIMQAVEEERLSEVAVRFKTGAACCVILASGGYPEAYEKGKTIDLGGADTLSDTWVFHSGTAAKDGQLVTSGGRVLGVTATGETLKAAIDRAYDAARRVRFDGMFMRSDIGKRALEVEGYHG